ncbi:hypothetical protein HRTV-11_gp52 [Halorubrum virus HRTV-11]|nr:hypothetical protein HRTV-11_gp52 [Halorubrum virus HRTV-11]
MKQHRELVVGRGALEMALEHGSHQVWVSEDESVTIRVAD